MTKVDQELLSKVSDECMDTIDKARALYPGCSVIGVVCVAVQKAYDAGFKAAGGTIERITLDGAPALDYKVPQ